MSCADGQCEGCELVLAGLAIERLEGELASEKKERHRAEEIIKTLERRLNTRLAEADRLQQQFQVARRLLEGWLFVTSAKDDLFIVQDTKAWLKAQEGQGDATKTGCV